MAGFTLAEKMKTAVEKSFPDADGAKGLEKLILKLCLFVVKFTFALDKIFYGKPIPKIRSFTKNNTPKNPLDLGIIPILRILASVDYCQIITYALSKVPKGKFDPKTPPKTDDPKLVKIKWQIQKAAYDTQLIIDNYEKDYLYANNKDSKNKLFRVVFEVRNTLLPLLEKAVKEPGTFYGTTQDEDAITIIYPQISVFATYFKNAYAVLDLYTDYRQVPNADWQKIVRAVQSVRQICILIQALNTPLAFLSSLAVSGLMPGLYEQLQRLERVLRPERAIPMLKRILEVCKSIQRICQVILNFVQLAQLIITIITILIRVFKIIILFLKLLPIPNAFTTAGITTTFSDVLAIIKDKGPTTFEKRLQQILLFLTLLTLLLRTILPILNEIIYNLSKIIATLENCANVDKTLVKDLKIVRNELQNSADLIYIFLKNKELNDIDNGTYNPDLIPIDQLLLNPGELDDTGIAASVGVGPTGNIISVAPPSNVSAANSDFGNLAVAQNSGTPTVGGNPVIGGAGGNLPGSIPSPAGATVTPGGAIGGVTGGTTTPTAAGTVAPTTTGGLTPVTGVKTISPAGGGRIPTVGGGTATPNQNNKDIVGRELGDFNQDVGIPEDLATAIDNVLKGKENPQPGKNITNPSTKFGEYSIQIIVEEVVEKTFKLKRRYGVALDKREEVIVQSTPTYASDSGIIIREVQQLLISKGLIKQSVSLYEPDEENIIKAATSYLYNKDINWKNYPSLSARMRARLGIDANGVRIPTTNLINPNSALNAKASSGGVYAGGPGQNVVFGPNSNIQSTNTANPGANNLSGPAAGVAGVQGGGISAGAGLAATVGGLGGTGVVGAGTGTGFGGVGTPTGTGAAGVLVGGGVVAAGNNLGANAPGVSIPAGGTEPIGAAIPVGIAFSSTAANDSALNELYLSDQLDTPFAINGIPGTSDFQINNFEAFNISGLGMENFLLDEFEVDSPDNEDENQGLGLNAFINKLKGGRKLRRKMRQIFAKKLAKLKSDLRAADPQGKYGSNVGSQVGTGTNKVASADENTENGTMTAQQQSVYQNNNVDLVTGDFAYKGVVLSNGSLVATVDLRADDPELAKQKLIDKYDPMANKNYSYVINPA